MKTILDTQPRRDEGSRDTSAPAPREARDVPYRERLVRDLESMNEKIREQAALIDAVADANEAFLLAGGTPAQLAEHAKEIRDRVIKGEDPFRDLPEALRNRIEGYLSLSAIEIGLSTLSDRGAVAVASGSLFAASFGVREGHSFSDFKFAAPLELKASDPFHVVAGNGVCQPSSAVGVANSSAQEHGGQRQAAPIGSSAADVAAGAIAIRTAAERDLERAAAFWNVPAALTATVSGTRNARLLEAEGTTVSPQARLRERDSLNAPPDFTALGPVRLAVWIERPRDGEHAVDDGRGGIASGVRRANVREDSSSSDSPSGDGSATGAYVDLDDRKARVRHFGGELDLSVRGEERPDQGDGGGDGTAFSRDSSSGVTGAAHRPRFGSSSRDDARYDSDLGEGEDPGDRSGRLRYGRQLR